MKMKKFTFTAITVLVILLGACNKESYYHTMSLVYPHGIAVIYADQKVDSILFITTDNFTLSSNASWLTIPEGTASAEVENAYRVIYQLGSQLFIEPNTTGSSRTAQVSVHSYGSDDWNNTAYASYQQVSWLNIQKPLPSYSYVDGIATSAVFQATDSATQVSDTLKFKVYDAWSLTDGTFIHPVTKSGNEGENIVILNIDVNTTSVARKDTLLLRSRGVETPIAFTQESKKD